MTGAQLRTWRATAQATQAELGAELGVDAATVSRIEGKPVVPRLYHLALMVVAQDWSHPLPETPA